jgi:DNA-binding CsgD family transcriptional regulator/PAS domain-containing protein
MEIGLATGQAVELIYRAVEDSRHWDDFLDYLVRELRLILASVSIHDPENQSWSFASVRGAFPEIAAAYASDWLDRDPWRRKLREVQPPVGSLLTGAQIVDDGELLTDEAFRRFFQPLGCRHGGAVALANCDCQRGWLLFLRSTAEGPLTDAESRWLQTLVPHLVRVAGVHGRTARLQAERDALAICFDDACCAAVLLDERAGILRANPGAEALLHRRQGLWRKDGKLRASQADGQKQLDGVLARAAAGGRGQARKAATAAIPRSGSATPLVVRATPLVRPGRDSVGASPSRVVLWMVDPVEKRQFGPQPFGGFFGLTAAEASVCAGLARGLSVQELAAQSHVSLPTIRTHLARVLAKTGTRSQSDLVALVLKAAEVIHPVGENHPSE